ncbi:MAG: hypothetical protein M0036_00585 [Desulfobacteraceae bacterium]|nr:hypothetical protein [Desulfobacteraceae bacterium]
MSRFYYVLGCVIIMLSLGLWACNPADKPSADLTDEEKQMPEAKYYSTDFVPYPPEITAAIANGPVAPEKALVFENASQLANPGYLETENGYAMLDDGSAVVAVKTDLPGVTAEMIRWWFVWHPLKDIRYKIWYPGAHYAIGVKDVERLTNEKLSYNLRFLNNPQYPVEDTGTGVMNLSIRFVSPESFGFDTATFRKAGIEAVVCGIVGFRIGDMTLDHTYMCHVFRKKGDGLELRSRFWLGKKLNMPKIRKLVITEEMATGMLLHCSREFTHLGGFLPQIYQEFGRQDQ